MSITFLATELVKGPRRSLTWRHPIAVSSSFGLLHGFGFAAALSEIGLPQTQLLTGLLFFNLGVEIASCCSPRPRSASCGCCNVRPPASAWTNVTPRRCEA